MRNRYACEPFSAALRNCFACNSQAAFCYTVTLLDRKAKQV
nr:MAG TPA: hypothetical protein [Caudoviricetes sp.]DAR31163.1 MAG TPA: hypothetical protein [Bacteriophage sp.]DAR41478.1 MAG TPA: hypothetical protein [Caudoviricetes sp.]DAS49512.1 MAG TPA: hypothetical protein [Caudoviricetes sp.]DAT61199.1 MAG TPA: hypothetical protein [Caudoviricetes sp.]